MKLLYHCNVEQVAMVVEGHLYVLPPDEVSEIENEIHAENILEHKIYLGVVEVAQVRTPKGIEFDLESAKQRSQQLLDQWDFESVRRWIVDTKEDRVARRLEAEFSLAAVPPPPRIAEIIQRRGYDLVPLGVIPSRGPDLEKETLRQQNASMAETIGKQNELLDKLSKRLDDLEAAKKAAKR